MDILDEIVIPKGERGWRVERESYIPEEDSFYEALFSISNGRVGIRATTNFDNEHAQPGCFSKKVYGQAISVSRHLVNILNPTYLTFEVNGLPLTLTPATISHFQQALDLKYAYTQLQYTHSGIENKITKILVTRFLLAEEDILITIIDATALNYSGFITIKPGISFGNGNSDFPGKRDYIKLHHLAIEDFIDDDSIFGVETRNRTDEQIVSVYSRIYTPLGITVCSKNNGVFVKNVRIPCQENIPIKVLLVSVFDSGLNKNRKQCLTYLQSLTIKKISDLLQNHFSQWEKQWDTATEIKADSETEQGWRYAYFQLAQLVDIQQFAGNVPARALTSEYHFGHFFFNTEYYLVPYFSYVCPQFAKILLRYRIATLQEARKYAEKTGYSGARFPEEADDFGMPAAPIEIEDLFTRDKIIEWSNLEVVHTSADVLYALFRYCEISGDKEFLFAESLPLIYFCAEYLASLMKEEPEINGRSAKSVMGFDEFHYHVDHHFATNWLARWGLLWVADIFDKIESENNLTQLTKLKEQNINISKYKTWRVIASEIYLPLPNKDGVYPVFHGYFDLPDQLKIESGSILQNVLSKKDEEKAERLENFSTTLTKQADVVFLMTLFPNYFSREEVKKCLDFYEPRTVHASSLSMTGHALAAVRCGDTELCHQLLYTSLRYNLDFYPRRHYKNGVHVAAYAGAWLTMLEGIAGFKVSQNCLELKPYLPQIYKQLSLRFFWRKCQLCVEINNDAVSIHYIDGPQEEIYIRFSDESPVALKKGQINLKLNVSSLASTSVC